jgi:hypothetical protein
MLRKTHKGTGIECDEVTVPHMATTSRCQWRDVSQQRREDSETPAIFFFLDKATNSTMTGRIVGEGTVGSGGGGQSRCGAGPGSRGSSLAWIIG